MMVITYGLITHDPNHVKDHVRAVIAAIVSTSGINLQLTLTSTQDPYFSKTFL